MQLILLDVHEILVTNYTNLHLNKVLYIPSKHFNIISTLFLSWYDVATSHNVKSTLCTSTLKFITWKNVETTLCFSTLNWTTLDNVKTTLSFSTSIFTTLGNVKTTLQIWPFEKTIMPRFKNKIIFLRFKHNMLVLKFSSFFPTFRGICKRTFVEPQKFLKHQIHWITKSMFKPSHFGKCQLVFNFKRQVQGHYDYQSFNFICIF